MGDIKENYYDLLGVRNDATKEEIDKAYKHLVRHFHPDVNKSKVANDKTKLLNLAHEILTNNEKREEYDRELGESKGRSYGGGKTKQRNPNKADAERREEFRRQEAEREARRREEFRRQQERKKAQQTYLAIILVFVVLGVVIYFQSNPSKQTIALPIQHNTPIPPAQQQSSPATQPPEPCFKTVTIQTEESVDAYYQDGVLIGQNLINITQHPVFNGLLLIQNNAPFEVTVEGNYLFFLKSSSSLQSFSVTIPAGEQGSYDDPSSKSCQWIQCSHEDLKFSITKPSGIEIKKEIRIVEHNEKVEC